MKTLSLSFFFILYSLLAFAQPDRNASTLRIIGNAKTFVKPDLGVLNINLSNTNMNFNNTILGLNEKTKELTKQIVSMGFKEETIKTLNFQINENKIYLRDQYIDSGYIASQSIQVEFKNDKETLTKILNTFSKSKINFNLSFSFKVSDALVEKTQHDLIVSAIKDAQKNAKLIVETSGVVLKKIKEIKYGTAPSQGGPEFMDGARFKTSAAASNDTMVGFTPNDILFEDQLTIIWDIE